MRENPSAPLRADVFLSGRWWQSICSELFLDIDTIERGIVNHVEYTLASTRFDFDDTKAYLATSHRYLWVWITNSSVRDRLIERFNDTTVAIDESNCKRVYAS